MNEHGFVFLPSYFLALNRLSDADRLVAYDAVMRYAFEGAEPKGLPPALESLFDLLRPNVDAGIKRYRSKCENGKSPKRGANANRGGSELKANEYKEWEWEQDMETERESATLVPPTFDSVKQFFTGRGFKSSAEQFFNHYCGIGWRVGGNSITDWQAIARRWEKREQELHPDKFAAAKWHADTRGFDVGYGEPVLDPETGETLPF